MATEQQEELQTRWRCAAAVYLNTAVRAFAAAWVLISVAITLACPEYYLQVALACAGIGTAAVGAYMLWLRSNAEHQAYKASYSSLVDAPPPWAGPR